ncbi:hypothetical protein B0F90DRAFT_1938367 [Multifurca ochricompacta]|uniref:Uncharacterized protein n=1 Tax=Multifurca ochricompacta TaxID=376703 RepID=A0AAD4M3E9_9AGAM|nr:hypothetical protein B0F90DRAFT_1938367 [Multifurca ochricompacta]
MAADPHSILKCINTAVGDLTTVLHPTPHPYNSRVLFQFNMTYTHAHTHTPTVVDQSSNIGLKQWLVGHHNSYEHEVTGETIHVYAIAGPPVYADGDSNQNDFDIEGSTPGSYPDC